MELIELEANVRADTGNGPARVLRREGRIPAILYGPGTQPVMLSIAAKDFETRLKASAGGQQLFKLTIKNDEAATHSVMIKELQTDPVSRAYLHVDFYKIAMDRKIRVNVPVVTKGKCAGVEMGGLLQIIRRDLEIECLPMQIPETIEIDITDLDIGNSVHVKEIPLSEGVEIPTDVNFTVVTVLSPTKEDEAEEAEEAEELTEEAETGESAEAEGEA